MTEQLLTTTSLAFNAGLLLLVCVLLWFYASRQKRLLSLEKERDQLASQKAYLEGQMQQLEQARSHMQQKEQAFLDLQDKHTHLLQEISALKSSKEATDKAAEEKLALMKESREKLSQEFEHLANKLLEQKALSLKEKQESFFDQTMKPLREQLGEFRQRIDKVYENESKDRVKLLAEIEQLKNLNLQMSEETINLTNALKGNQKFQGNWGEFILERVLEDSGLRKGFEYELQAKRYDSDGKLRLPDVIVHLPDKKDLIIDAKVSLLDYQRYCESTDPDEKSRFLNAHMKSLEQHIRGLSVKDYEDLEGVNTLDFVLLFVPVEAAFLLALESDPTLFQLAYDKHIILVSPTTLLATLRTIENLWRYEKQNRNAEEIARQAGGLYDQCMLFVESLEDIGKHLQRSTDAYEKSFKRLSQGKGNLLGRVSKLKKLGAKTKKQIPGHIDIETDSEDDDEFDLLESDTED